MTVDIEHDQMIRGPLRQRRLSSATGYITPKEMLAGRQQEIHAERDRKLEAARKIRKDRRQASCMRLQGRQATGVC